MPITIVCIEPEHALNIGAVCRVMKNFGFNKLVLVRPKFKKDDPIAIRYSKHAVDVLKKAVIVDSDSIKYLENFDYAVATTAKLGTDYNIARNPLTSEEFAKWCLTINKKLNICLVIGREGHGLSNEEIEACDFTVTIPSDSKYRTLNISHALGILLYDITRENNAKEIKKAFPSASGKDIDVLISHIHKSLDSLEFSTNEKKETQKKLWKRIISRAGITRREAFGLMGYFRKVK